MGVIYAIVYPDVLSLSKTQKHQAVYMSDLLTVVCRECCRQLHATDLLKKHYKQYSGIDKG